MRKSTIQTMDTYKVIRTSKVQHGSIPVDVSIMCGVHKDIGSDNSDGDRIVGMVWMHPDDPPEQQSVDLIYCKPGHTTPTKIVTVRDLRTLRTIEMVYKNALRDAALEQDAHAGDADQGGRDR